jgi:predicted lipoprotein with Yx(FWY)xxD motif
MKKLIIASVIAISTVFAGAASAQALKDVDDWLTLGKNFMRSAIPTQVNALEADGKNMRLYTFKSPADATGNTVCHFVAGTQKGGMACYKQN